MDTPIHVLRSSKSTSDIHLLSPDSPPPPRLPPRTHHPSLTQRENSPQAESMTPHLTFTPPPTKLTHLHTTPPNTPPPPARAPSPAASTRSSLQSSRASQISLPNSNDSFSGLFYQFPTSAPPPRDGQSSSAFPRQRVHSNPDLFGPLLTDYHRDSFGPSGFNPIATSTPPHAPPKAHFTIERPGIPASFGGGQVTFPTRWEFPPASPTTVVEDPSATLVEEGTPRRRVPSFTDGLRKWLPGGTPKAKDADVESGIVPLTWGERVRAVSMGDDRSVKSTHSSTSSKKKSKGKERPPPLEPASYTPMPPLPVHSPFPMLSPRSPPDVFSSNTSVPSFYTSSPPRSPNHTAPPSPNHPAPLSPLLPPPPLMFSPPPTPPPVPSSSRFNTPSRRRGAGSATLLRQPVLSVIEGSPKSSSGVSRDDRAPSPTPPPLPGRVRTSIQSQASEMSAWTSISMSASSEDTIHGGQTPPQASPVEQSPHPQRASTFSWNTSTARPSSGSVSGASASASGGPRRKSIQSVGSVFRKLTEGSRSSLALEKSREEIADEEFMSRSDTPTSTEVRELRSRSVDMDREAEEAAQEVAGKEEEEEEEEADAVGTMSGAPMARSTSISSRRELILPRLVEARAMGGGTASPTSPSAYRASHLRRRSSASSGGIMLTPSPSPHRTHHFSVPGGRKVRILSPRSPMLSMSMSLEEQQAQQAQYSPRPLLLQSSATVSRNGMRSPGASLSFSIPQSPTPQPNLDDPLLSRPSSPTFTPPTAKTMLINPRTALHTALPAQSLFLLGFILGPWAWVIGGWLLSPDGHEHSVDRDGAVAEPSKYAKRRVGTSSRPGSPSIRTRGDSTNWGVGDETFSTMRTNHSIGSASLALLAASSSGPAEDPREKVPSVSPPASRRWSWWSLSLSTDMPNAWVWRCRVAAVLSGGAIFAGAVIAVAFAARHRT